MIYTFPKSRIVGAVFFLCIMVTAAVGLSIILNTQRAAINNKVDTHALEDARVADMIKIARYAREEDTTVQMISQAFKVATDTIAIIEEIESIAASKNVKLDIRSADKERFDDGSQTLTINASAVGSWANTYAFVEAIDTFPYQHETHGIGFDNVVSEANGNKVWSVTIEMKVPLAHK